MALKIIWGNILDEACDAIVTPASRRPRIGSGLDGVIHKAAGPKLLEARMELGKIGPGIVKVTDSFNLRRTACRAKHVIHALGPFCLGELDGAEPPILLGCYLQILCTAASIGAKTVSVPVMSSGKFGMPMDMAVDVAVEAITLFLESRPDMTVKLVGIDLDFHEYARRKYPQLTTAKIDPALVEAYRKNNRRERDSQDPDFNDCPADYEPEDQPYFERLRFRQDVAGKGFRQLFRLLWERVQERAKKTKNKTRCSRDGQYFLVNQKELALISGVSARYIRSICSNEKRKITPSKDVVLALAVAMRLDIDYVDALLRTCGEVLGRDSRDEAIAGFILRGGGRVTTLNCLLDDKHLPPLQTGAVEE